MCCTGQSRHPRLHLLTGGCESAESCGRGSWALTLGATPARAAWEAWADTASGHRTATLTLNGKRNASSTAVST